MHHVACLLLRDRARMATSLPSRSPLHQHGFTPSYPLCHWALHMVPSATKTRSGLVPGNKSSKAMVLLLPVLLIFSAQGRRLSTRDLPGRASGTWLKQSGSLGPAAQSGRRLWAPSEHTLHRAVGPQTASQCSGAQHHCPEACSSWRVTSDRLRRQGQPPEPELQGRDPTPPPVSPHRQPLWPHPHTFARLSKAGGLSHRPPSPCF